MSMMSNYYKDGLHSENLFKVYQTNIKRVDQYLREEIAFVKKRLRGCEHVLEIGSGYGRILKQLAPSCAAITGIDISEKNVAFAKEYLQENTNVTVVHSDIFTATNIGTYDVVLCMQNGISAIKGDISELVAIIVRSLKDHGSAYLSTYSETFWKHRLEWFMEQQDKGLIGEIDFDTTKHGILCCKDGFVSRSYSKNELEEIAKKTKCTYELVDVDASSLFLVLHT